jgi:hypothetical protein
MLEYPPTRKFSVLSLTVLLAAASAFAQGPGQTGKLKLHVSPKQAYLFVDGNAVRDGNQTVTLGAGRHSIGIYNYGFTPQTQTVEITAGKTTDVNVNLQASGNKVAGPFGDIELKGHPRAAVLLNGDTPSYFVGHADEFDNNWLWHQWLLVKPGNYHLTATQDGKTIWSGPVDVKAGQRVIVNLNRNGAMKTKEFKRGLDLGPQPRFEAGVASAMVPVAPVSAELSASQNSTSCGQSANLSWSSTDAAEVSISNIGDVAGSGDHSVSPTQATAYQLVAKGPGGEVTRSVTINVDAQPTATLTLTPSEIRFHKVGDKVVQQDSATLNWSTTDANNVTVAPLGTVANNGSQNIEASPNGANSGPIDRTITYTLHAANACGGTTTKTATLHVVGSIDPAPPVTLASVFYPTAYPERKHPQVGLLSSQKQTLTMAANTFKNNEQYDSQNKLTVVAHADVRGAEKYNQALSERRAELVKNYLVSQGISADKIEVRAEGKKDQLDPKQVQELQSQNTEKPQTWMTKRQKVTWLAYNRRVDIVLEPAGQVSAKVYPNDTPDARILWQRSAPKLKTVERAEVSTGPQHVETIATNR